jgi:predicted DsbA family dithiol-disulfide isomerase
MAFESANIRAACVEATEFMDLSRRYGVSSVPKTIVNGTAEILGALPEDLFVRSVVESLGIRDQASGIRAVSGPSLPDAEDGPDP